MINLNFAIELTVCSEMLHLTYQVDSFKSEWYVSFLVFSFMILLNVKQEIVKQEIKNIYTEINATVIRITRSVSFHDTG